MCVCVCVLVLLKQIATWDLTNCGIGDAGLRALLPAWWRIFSFTAPAREIRLSGNWLGGAGLAPFFNMLNGEGSIALK